ncbi:hypothetical protein [Hwanghaeella sp.]|uniref:hypothetical protein n=1 Tax=Hwanghaeella sp. TaxID=2605943 RepID=UPI003CCC01BE
MFEEPAEKNILRRRGDTRAFEFEMKQGGAAYDITGFSYLLTVNPRRSPADDTEQAFQLAGVVVDGPGGVVRFPITAPAAALLPGVYFYDVQETDDAGEDLTVIAGTWTVRQDITK